MASQVQLFVNQLLERAVKTAAQSALAVYTVDSITSTADLKHMGWVAGSAALASLLTSLASIKTGEPDSPSLVKTAAPVPSVSTEPVVLLPVTAVDAAEAIFPRDGTS